jgi:hypothetical protein
MIRSLSLVGLLALSVACGGKETEGMNPGDCTDGADNDANGRMAANYLHQHGHKSLAVIAADSGYSAVGWRVKAFLEQAKELGLTVHSILGKTKPVNFLEVVPVHEESDALAKRFCQISPRPTGIYVPVDHFCGSLFRSLRLRGKHQSRKLPLLCPRAAGRCRRPGSGGVHRPPRCRLLVPRPLSPGGFPAPAPPTVVAVVWDASRRAAPRRLCP